MRVMGSMGVTCGCVREPGSCTLLVLVGFVVFSTKSKKTTNPTLKLWHAVACVLCRAQAAHKTGETCSGVMCHVMSKSRVSVKKPGSTGGSPASSGQTARAPRGTLMGNLYGPWECRRLACPRQGFGTAKPLPDNQSPLSHQSPGGLRTLT